MSYKKDTTVPFSGREQKIIKIISSRKVTRTYICHLLFTDENRPFNAEIIVGNCVRSIIAKCRYHKLPWTLLRTNTGSGRQTISKENV